MIEAPTSGIEQQRLDALARYALAEVPHDPALDDLARLAAQLCNSPVAAISIIERDQVVLIGRYGTEIESAPRHSIPCETTISGEGIYQIPDARRDPEWSPGGIPFGDRRYRFYAGAPILTPHAVPIGCLAVLDTAARKLTLAQVESLESLSHAVTTRLELIYRVRETDYSARERLRVESALTVERNFVSAVLDTVGALVVVFDTAGRIVRFNRACEIISGYKSADLVGKYAWERLIPETDVPAYIESFDRIRSGQFPTTYENYWVAADGTRRRISWSATALVDSQRQVAFIIATGIDVTVQRIAETTIRESESRYRQIVEGSLGMVATHGLGGVILSINQYGAQGIGRRVEDVVGHPLTSFLYPNRHTTLEPYVQQLLRTGEAQGLFHLQHLNGEERVIAYRNRLVEPRDGAPYVLAFGVDITEQIRAEEQLRALIRQSNSVLESVGDGIFGIDLDGRCTVVNPAAAQMLGYRPEELLGRNMLDLVHHTRSDGSPYVASQSPIALALRNRTTVRVSNEVFWRKDGASFPVEYVARPQIETAEETLPVSAVELQQPLAEQPNGDATASIASVPQAQQARLTSPAPIVEGRAVGVVVAFTDISERNALDRMKDEFISTVSHELRTPLTSLRAALGLVAAGALNARPERIKQMMEIAIGNTDRLVRLVNDILDLERIGSGKAELHRTTCSVDELMRRTVALLSAAAQKANVRFVIEANNVQVYGDADRILQTLTNLVSNAIKFSPQSETLISEIRLTAHNVTPDEALIEIEDHGRGIPSDKLQQIFERFKQVDASDSRDMGGTGLGLAICRSIVQQHGGTIWATSELGQGSTFHFTLPTHPSGHLG
ncbi:PAS domain S-box-containing protein [Bryocella elongata]|uniref:histidine kinase n=1 Tax=Bryocella elongata TaxID=863522 RepID=A0A1H6B390_9BACT|nr:PAS domain S-box protein [Bryocella elongata]SEG54576.1 PAS domain S-box-containing protein [Bryocella elongata]